MKTAVPAALLSTPSSLNKPYKSHLVIWWKPAKAKTPAATGSGSGRIPSELGHDQLANFDSKHCLVSTTARGGHLPG